MDNDFAEIDEHPSCLWIPLYAPRSHSRFFFGILGDRPSQCAQLALIFSVTENEVIGENRLVANVKHQNIATFFVNNRINQLIR